MNQIIIFFVPAGAAQRHFEDALREQFTSLQSERLSEKKAAHCSDADNDQFPLWTWFLPNPGLRHES